MRTRQLAPALPAIALAVAALTSDAVIRRIAVREPFRARFGRHNHNARSRGHHRHDPRCSATSIRSTDNHGSAAFLSCSRRYQPTRDSNIKFEVWLPLANWNGRFAGTGNGTTAGSIIYAPIGLVEG